jgi:glycosidase
MKRAWLFALIFTVLLINNGVFAQEIKRVEPPFWWAGMNNAALQLLVQGDQIGDLRPVINEPGITLQQIRKVENPNFLFLDLLIGEDVRTGTFQISFMRGNRVVSTTDYELKRRKWSSESIKGFDNSDVLYLITPDRFANGDPSNDTVKGLREKQNRDFKGGRHGGDIAGIADHLDYIKDLGFTAVWMNPVLENDMEAYSYHGYSTTDFYKVDPRFGSNESYQKLALEARSKGIGLIMDMIVNHCGLNHWWMEDRPSKDWINTWEEYTQTNHRKTVLQDPYASKLDKKTFADGWFVPTMPDLNQRNPMMATYLIQNSIWWIEYLGLAGIRMDTYPYPDMDYMTEWTRRVMEEYPNFNVVGEEWNEDPSIVAYWQKGKENPNGYTSELKSVMDFPVQATLVKALNEKEEDWGQGWIKLYEMIAQDFIYADPYNLVTFPDNHDMSRFFTQVKEDYDLWKLGMVFTLTTRGIPQIYYGSEVLMTNPGTTDHGIIRSDFPGGWSGDQVDAVSGEGLTVQQKAAKDFLKKVLQWRKEAAVIHYGKLLHFVPEDKVYVYFRYDEAQKYMVILNKNKEAYNLKLARFKEILEGARQGKDVISGASLNLQSGQITLKPMEPMILKVN